MKVEIFLLIQGMCALERVGGIRIIVVYIRSLECLPWRSHSIVIVKSHKRRLCLIYTVRVQDLV